MSIGHNETTIENATLDKLSSFLIEYPFGFSSQELTKIYMALDLGLNSEDLEDHFPHTKDLLRPISRFLFKADLQGQQDYDFGERRERERKIWKSLGSEIEKSNSFVQWGDRRGSRYRNAICRPMLPTSVISEACILALDESYSEMNWKGIWKKSLPHLRDIHSNFENNPSSEQSAAFSIACDILGKEGEKHLSGPFEKELDRWVENMYSEAWFWSSWPVIQRTVSKRARKGSKRGLWISLSPEKPQSNNSLVELARLEMEMHMAINKAIEAYRANNLHLGPLRERLELQISSMKVPISGEFGSSSITRTAAI